MFTVLKIYTHHPPFHRPRPPTNRRQSNSSHAREASSPSSPTFAANLTPPLTNSYPCQNSVVSKRCMPTCGVMWWPWRMRYNSWALDRVRWLEATSSSILASRSRWKIFSRPRRTWRTRSRQLRFCGWPGTYHTTTSQYCFEFEKKSIKLEMFKSGACMFEFDMKSVKL